MLLDHACSCFCLAGTISCTALQSCQPSEVRIQLQGKLRRRAVARNPCLHAESILMEFPISTKLKLSSPTARWPDTVLPEQNPVGREQYDVHQPIVSLSRF